MLVGWDGLFLARDTNDTNWRWTTYVEVLFSFWGPRHFSRTEVMIWFFIRAGVWRFKPLKIALEYTWNITFATCLVPVHVFPTGIFRWIPESFRSWEACEWSELLMDRWRTLQSTVSDAWENSGKFSMVTLAENTVLAERSGEPCVRPLGSNSEWETMMMLTSDDFLGAWFVYDLYFVDLLLDFCENAGHWSILFFLRYFTFNAWTSCVELRSSHFPRSVVNRSTRRSHPISDSALVLMQETTEARHHENVKEPLAHGWWTEMSTRIHEMK